MALTKEQVALMSPEQKATLRAELIAKKDSILSSQAAPAPVLDPVLDQAPAEPQSKGVLATVSKSLFPGSTANVEAKDPEEIRNAKNEIEAINNRRTIATTTPEELEADNVREEELIRIISKSNSGAFGEVAKTSLAALGDVGSLLTRGLSALKESFDAPSGEKLDIALKTLQDTEAGIFKGSREESNKFYNDLIADTDSKVLKGVLTGIKFFAEASIGVIEDPASLVTGATKAVSKVPKGLKSLEKGLEKITKAPGAAVAGVSGQLSGVSGEALQEAGLGFGKKARALKEASQEKGASFNIGEDLVEKLQNFDQFIPEASTVNAALSKMGNVPTKGVIESLESSLIKNATTPAANTSNDVIQKTIDKLKGLGNEIPAEDFRKLRIQFDEGIGFETPGFSSVEKAFNNARQSMASELVKSARKTGNTEFISAMKTFSKKLKAKDKLSKLLGKSKAAQSQRAETFVNTLFGKGKTARQGLVKQFDEIFGSDFFEKIKTAKLSAELGPKGVPTLLPKPGGSRQIGAGVLLGGAGSQAVGQLVLPVLAGLASPKISSKIAGLFDLIGSGTFKATKALAKLSVKDDVLAAEAFNTVIKSLSKVQQKSLAGMVEKREGAKNARNKQNIDKRINIILEKGL